MLIPISLRQRKVKRLICVHKASRQWRHAGMDRLMDGLNGGKDGRLLDGWGKGGSGMWVGAWMEGRKE